MADLFTVTKKLGSAEVRTFDVDFTDDLRTGKSVSTATAVLTAPDKTTSSPSATVASNIVTLAIGPVGKIGTYTLDVLATLSDADISVARLVLDCIF